MIAIIKYYLEGEISALIDGKCVATCYITGLVAGKNGTNIFEQHITFNSDAERFCKFLAYCDELFGVRFEVERYYKYHFKWADDCEYDMYATDDEDAKRLANSSFNPHAGIITQEGRFVGSISEKPPTEFYIARKTWKRRDITNPRYK